jgi:hypothetical protein
MPEGSLGAYAPREDKVEGDAVPNEVRRDAVPSEARDASLSLGRTRKGGSEGRSRELF